MKASMYYLGSLLVAVTFFFTACSNVKFEQAMPQEEEALSAFPKHLQGNYQDKEGAKLSITDQGFSYHEFESGKAHSLSDCIVLKKKGKHYYLNFQSEDSYWDVVQVEAVEERLFLRMIDLEEAELDALDQISPILNNAKGIEEDEEFVLINPDKVAFEQLLEKGIFSDLVEFELIGESIF